MLKNITRSLRHLLGSEYMEAVKSVATQINGMSEEEALKMMEHETWLTAEQAKERGLIDAIMFEETEVLPMVAGPMFALPSEENMEKARKMMQETDERNNTSVFLLQQNLNLLKLRGEKR